jgi:transposase-like protein
MSLESRGYATRYKSNDNRELKYVFFSHEDAIVQARRFHEVVLIDTTYKTNRQGLLFVNIVGISNIGTRSSLNTFTIAGGLLVNEDEYAMSWMMAVLKETVFNNGELPIFVTDAAMQLRNAIAAIFHTSKHLLCTWHVANNFETRFMKTFKEEDHWLELKSSLKAIINSRTPEDFEKAKETYLAVSKLSDDSKDVVQYLQR